MTYAGNRRSLSLTLAALVAGMLLLPAERAQAQDLGGLLNLFGTRTEPTRPAPQPQYYRPAPPSGYYQAPRVTYRSIRPARAAERVEEVYRSRRATRSQEPRTRYAALPKAETAKSAKGKLTGENAGSDPVNNKQFVDQKAINADPTAAILRDPTLRAGDIVVTADGPKVFTGSSGRTKASGARHRLRDFADVKTSKAVDKKTRQLLLAMMAPVGALPAHEARKVLAKMRKIAPDEDIAPVAASARLDAAPRVIVPWKTTASGLSRSAVPGRDDAPAPSSTVKVSLPTPPKTAEDDAANPKRR